MKDLDFLKEFKEPIFYVTNDVAKGIGPENILPNYHIICLDDHPLVDYLLESKLKVFCLERALKERNKIFRSTSKVIDHPMALEYIKKESGGKIPQIMFFKPSAKIDLICKKYGFKKIGNSVELNRLFEDKVSFYEICLKEKFPVPLGEIGILKDMTYEKLFKSYGLPLIVQFGRGWAGSTTYFIESKENFEDLQNKFSTKKVKITKFIDGKTVLNNACVYGKKILVSPPAEQINAVEGFTSKKGATCGRQWPAGIDNLSKIKIENITRQVGIFMQKHGYKGYFGLDFLVDHKNGSVFLSENNARLTASVPFFTKLEIFLSKTPLLVYHILAFTGKKISLSASSDNKVIGSEVVARNDSSFPVRVKGNILPGVYKIIKGKLILKRKDYFPENLTKEEFWLDCASKERIVNPEMELIKTDFPKKVINKHQILDSSIVKVFTQIKKQLFLEDVKT